MYAIFLVYVFSRAPGDSLYARNASNTLCIRMVFRQYERVYERLDCLRTRTLVRMLNTEMVVHRYERFYDFVGSLDAQKFYRKPGTHTVDRL